MFENVGSKIKSLAKTLTEFGIMISLIIGFYIASHGKVAIIIGIIVIGVGSLLSWISSFVLYGYGELIERIQNIDERSKAHQIEIHSNIHRIMELLDNAIDSSDTDEIEDL